MSEIVPGQFDDADEDSSDISKIIKDANPDEDFIESRFDLIEERLLQDYSSFGQESLKHLQPVDKALSSKYMNHLNLGYYEKSLKAKEYKNDRFFKTKEKSDRATVEGVLDPRTKLILLKLFAKNVFKELNGVISTGKEANVYHATSHLNNDKAVKIFKTSILTFKDRDQYISGEHRFRRGYARKNPRKMVEAWAEKEARNLARIAKGGVRCPQLYLLKGHVLVMEFIGKQGWPAPLLKDVDLCDSKYRQLYLDCVLILRKLYQDCKLVHADLSEFNLLYHCGEVVVIDVSQSVEHDHPHSLDFLRKDCHNINEYFAKKKVSVLSLKELFDFVTDVNINEGNIDEKVTEMMKQAVEKSNQIGYNRNEIDVEEEVFRQRFIPRTLNEVRNFEADLEKVKKEGCNDILYKSVTGVELGSQSSKDDEESSDEDVEDEDLMKRVKNIVISRKNMTKEEIKAHRKQVKDANREKRLEKIPKHVKKRKEKVSNSRRK